MAEPFSIQYLRQLKVAQVYRYYIGNFQADIIRAEQDAIIIRNEADLIEKRPVRNKSNKQISEGVARYGAMLRQVQEEAERLQRDGLVKLSQKKLQKEITIQVRDETGNVTEDKPFKLPMTEYYATGARSS